MPQAKTLNMLPSYLIFKKVKEKEAFDALFLDKQNNIIEGTRSNFFAIKDKTLYTTTVEKVLAGVTRQTVIDCTKKNNYKIIEQDINLIDVFNYEGAFLTNTSGKIIPIRKIDNKEFANICGSLKELIKLYNTYLNNLYF